jgi:Glycosyl transferase family 2
MKLVMTLLARDEADIVDAHVAYHLNAGVDFVLATAHRSRDGTAEILRSYEREGCLQVIREESERWDQIAWVTRMARAAAAELRADWVINSDADEFWWPRGGDLKQVLAEVPRAYGIVRAFWRNFVPRPDDGSCFYERMTVRLAGGAPINDPTNQYRPTFKVVHRADPGVIVANGNHRLLQGPVRPVRGWYPIELLHFPLRSFSQYERRYRVISEVLGKDRRGDHTRVERARAAGRLAETYEALVVRGSGLERGLAEGHLAVDERLRDRLRALALPDGRGVRRFRPSAEAPARLDSSRPGLDEEMAYATEAAAANEAEMIRLQRRLDALEERLAQCRVQR